MRIKVKWGHIALYLLMAVLIVFNAGCSRYITLTYYYPDWTPDGKIICVKKMSVGGSSGGMNSPYSPADYRYFITVMDADGGNEKDIKEIGGVGRVVMSPLGNYIAYVIKYSNIINIISSNGSEMASIDGECQIYSFDWGNNEDKLIISTDDKAKLFNRDGSNEIILADNGFSIAWRYGDKIILKKPISVGAYGTFAINSITLTEEAIYSNISGGEFNISKANTNEVVYSTDSGINKFFLDSPGSDPVDLNNVTTVYDIRLSPNGQNIIGTGYGSQDFSGNEIWIMNIDGSELTRLR